ncbi:hypothetical protein U1Q18_050293 [Sarracenia purpurea var. burkii]
MILALGNLDTRRLENKTLNDILVEEGEGNYLATDANHRGVQDAPPVPRKSEDRGLDRDRRARTTPRIKSGESGFVDDIRVNYRFTHVFVSFDFSLSFIISSSHLRK